MPNARVTIINAFHSSELASGEDRPGLNGSGRIIASRAGAPNLFLVGAMKGGTTLLWKLLASHPSIFMSIPKEPSHFIYGDELRRLQPHLWRHGYWRSRERYLELFASAADIPIRGEASVYYSYLPLARDVPERIHAFNPDARILYIMRDPIQRTISHYWHNVQNNWEYRAPAEAIFNSVGYREASHYAMQLTPYLRIFPADRVKALTIEELLAAPDAAMAEIYGWLDLDVSPPLPAFTPENETPPVVRKKPHALGRLKSLADRSPIAQRLLDAIPSPLRAGLSQALARPVVRSGVDVDEVMRALAPEQQSQTEELSALLGRTFPEWTLLHSL